jgi:hypothetical protein
VDLAVHAEWARQTGMPIIRAIRWTFLRRISILGLTRLREIPDVVPAGYLPDSWRTVMLTYLMMALSNWFENAERRRREAYLAQSADIFELERRIRALENHGYRSF